MDDDVEAAASAFVEASRALMGVSLRSIAAAPIALTVPQHRLLVRITADGSRRVGELAADLGVDQSNASRLINRLVTLGLVKRVPDSQDGRASVVTLTSLGQTIVDAVTQHRMRQLRIVVDSMPDAVRADAVAVLGAFNSAARESEDDMLTVHAKDPQ